MLWKRNSPVPISLTIQDLWFQEKNRSLCRVSDILHMSTDWLVLYCSFSAVYTPGLSIKYAYILGHWLLGQYSDLEVRSHLPKSTYRSNIPILGSYCPNCPLPLCLHVICWGCGYLPELTWCPSSPAANLLISSCIWDDGYHLSCGIVSKSMKDDAPVCSGAGTSVQ